MALDVSQKAPARALEKAANEAFAEYTRLAEILTAAWKKAGRPRPGGYFDPKSKDYADYQNALEDKEEAYRKFQRAQSAHGHHLLPKSKMAGEE
jgi:hypothetical protein